MESMPTPLWASSIVLGLTQTSSCWDKAAMNHKLREENKLYQAESSDW